MEELDIANTDIFVLVRCCTLCDPIAFMFCGVETNSTLHMKKMFLLYLQAIKQRQLIPITTDQSVLHIHYKKSMRPHVIRIQRRCVSYYTRQINRRNKRR